MATTASQFFTVSLSANPRLHALITTPVPTPVSDYETPAPTVIFLHYWGGSAQTWHHLPHMLSPPCTTISISFRGWGQSTGPLDSRGYTIAQLANDVLDLLPQLSSHLTDGFLLVGHSMGAKVAVAVASDRPPGLRGIMLISPPPFGPWTLPPQLQERQRRSYESKETVRWSIENMLSEPHNLSRSDVALVVRDSLAGTEAAKAAWPHYGMAEAVSIGPERRGIPVIVLVGQQDRITTVEQVRTEVVDLLRHRGFSVEFAIKDDCGHLMPLEKPEFVAHAIRKMIFDLS